MSVSCQAKSYRKHHVDTVSGYAILPAPEIIFGCGKRFSLAERLPQHGKIVLVCGRHFAASGEAARLCGRSEVTVFTMPSGEPDIATVDSLRETAKNAAAIVAVGGGSAIDAAKAAAALADASESCAEYFYGRATAPERRIFLAALPTTAGTGAEMTGNAVLSDRKTMLKQSLRSPGMKPDIAIIDPELLYGAPAGTIASSGFDALTQALESLISKKANSFTRPLAQQAAATLLDSLHMACNGEKAALAAIAEASALTGVAFAASGLGAVHGIAHPLGSVRHIPHGTACALLLPHILDFNRAAITALGYDPDALIAQIVKLRRELELPAIASGYGLVRSDFDFIVNNCRSGSMTCNPRTMSDADVRNILEAIL